jgi:hypothetical protein
MSNGRQPGDSHGESSLGGNSLKGPLVNPHVRSFRWPTNPCMFIPPWYQQPIVQLVPEPTIKLPYK